MGHFKNLSSLFLVVYVLSHVPFAPHVGHCMGSSLAGS